VHVFASRICPYFPIFLLIRADRNRTDLQPGMADVILQAYVMTLYFLYPVLVSTWRI